MKYSCLGYIEDEYFGGPTAWRSAVPLESCAKIGLDDRSFERRSLASLYRVVVPARKAK